MVYIGRGINKIPVDYGIKDFYKYYNDNAKNPLEFRKFKEIWLDIAKVIIRLIVYRNLDFMIPARMGTLCVRKILTKPIVREDGTVDKSKLSINYKASWEKWFREYPGLTKEDIAKLEDKKPIYYLNEHSDGYKVKYKWDKYTCTVKNQSIYNLQITRGNKKELSEAFKNFKTDYYEYKRK